MRAVIREETQLPREITRVAEIGRSEGFPFVDRLIHEWEGGANRFDQAGELFLCVYGDGSLVGFGGLNRDPYCTEPSVGRVRHVYLEPAARGCGWGAELVQDLIEKARPAFSRLRLTTQQAAPFYEHLGFVPASEHKATHVLSLR